MDGRLRILAPIKVRAAVGDSGAAGLFWCCVSAIVMQLTLSTHVLSVLGYTGKVHPATMFLVGCILYGVGRGVIPLHQRLRDAPGLVMFFFGIPAVMLYSVFFNGLSGATVFVETFWSAGILALLLEPATARQKRLLAGILIALVTVNVVVGLYESLTQTELFQLTFDPDAVDASDESVEDFRAHAFYIHPLTASLVTSMGIFLLYSMRMRMVFAAPLFGLMLMGLLAYGGRTALGVTVVVSVVMAVCGLVAGLAKRRLSSDFLMAIGLAVVVIPLVVTVVITQTTIADRIIDNLYFDGSAEARVTQWEVFRHLSLKDWLFGISKDQLNAMKYQIGLGGAGTDIENCWILISLDLGVLGFTAFVFLFFGFLLHLGRYANVLNGWLLIGSALVIDSTANSLGVWGNDLFIETAILVAMAGFSGYMPVRQRRRIRKELPVLALQQLRSGPRSLALAAKPFNQPNLRGGKPG